MSVGTTPTGEPSSSAPDIGPVQFLVALGIEKRSIAVTLLGAALIGLAVAYLLPVTYTGRTTLLPPQQNLGGSSMMATSLGALAASAGIPSALKTPEELFVGLMRTDAVAESLVRRFDLTRRYEKEKADDAKRLLANATRISADRKSSLIQIEVDDGDPSFAAQLANGYAEELRKLMSRLAVTEAQHRRFFFEQQLDKVKNDLSTAELALKQAQEKSGLISLDAQTQAAIGAVAQLRAQIVAREVQVQALRPYAGPQNPELTRLLSELSSLKSQVARMEGGNPESAPSNGPQAVVALSNVRLFRELKYQEALYSALLQQLQLAKADEAREAPLVQQIDVAKAPERKSKPNRALIMLVALAFGLLVGILVACVRHLARNSDPNGDWMQLARAWSLRETRLFDVNK